MTAKSPIKAGSFKPLKDKVFVTDLEQGARVTNAGIIIPDDDMTERGIRPRWARVYAVGPEVTDIAPGEWICIAHGRWTNGIKLQTDEGIVTVWSVDYPAHVMVAADKDPRHAHLKLA